VRLLSADVARKEDMIKELRAKIRPLDQAQEALDAKEEALKKARTDLERKEQAASSAKARVQSGFALFLSLCTAHNVSHITSLTCKSDITSVRLTPTCQSHSLVRDGTFARTEMKV
jgi:prefoldin subunit 5